MTTPNFDKSSKDDYKDSRGFRIRNQKTNNKSAIGERQSKSRDGSGKMSKNLDCVSENRYVSDGFCKEKDDQNNNSGSNIKNILKLSNNKNKDNL